MQSTSIIISTYNKPHFLKKVLTGYTCQTNKDFSIIIADDGSDHHTTDLISEFISKTNLDISHVWHKDDGFRKSTILNKAILKSESDYLIFSDGDCIPDQYFVATHLTLRKKGYFLSGGHFPLSRTISKLITEEHIISQECFSKKFLRRNGQPLSKKYLKLLKTSFFSKILDQITPTKSTFNGNNVSAWREDILKVKGFDERMEYGGLDCELGYRLKNINIKSKQIRHQASCLHLYHDRPYKNKLAILKNRSIKKQTLKEKNIITTFGIKS
tara:strand:- start:886 stop:1698 length:813 start_codon:yes stop_codon:yes gene_type:complete